MSAAWLINMACQDFDPASAWQEEQDSDEDVQNALNDSESD